MTQKYISKNSHNIKKWHTEQDCSAVQSTALEPVEESEIPDWVRACSECADGISAYDLMGEKA